MPRIDFSKFYLHFGITENHLCELFDHQFMYGAREVLLEYMGISYDSVFCGVLQHGVGDPRTLWNNYPSPRINLKRSPVWLASPAGRTYLAEQGVKNAQAIGSAWAYYLKLRGRVTKNSCIHDGYTSKRNIIFFPDHGSWNTSEQYDASKISNTLLSLRKKFPHDSITVCVYFTDLFSGNWQKFAEEFGFQVVCAGNGVTSPAWSLNPGRLYFFDNLHTFLLQHEVALFQSYSSAIFYALSVGLPIMLDMEGFPRAFNRDAELIEDLKSEFPQISKDFSSDSALVDYANEIIGFESVLNPASLATTLNPKKIGVLSREYNGFQRRTNVSSSFASS